MSILIETVASLGVGLVVFALLVAGTYGIGWAVDALVGDRRDDVLSGFAGANEDPVGAVLIGMFVSSVMLLVVFLGNLALQGVGLL